MYYWRQATTYHVSDMSHTLRLHPTFISQNPCLLKQVTDKPIWPSAATHVICDVLPFLISDAVSGRMLQNDLGSRIIS